MSTPILSGDWSYKEINHVKSGKTIYISSIGHGNTWPYKKPMLSIAYNVKDDKLMMLITNVHNIPSCSMAYIKTENDDLEYVAEINKIGLIALTKNDTGDIRLKEFQEIMHTMENGGMLDISVGCKKNGDLGMNGHTYTFDMNGFKSLMNMLLQNGRIYEVFHRNN